MTEARGGSLPQGLRSSFYHAPVPGKYYLHKTIHAHEVQAQPHLVPLTASCAELIWASALFCARNRSMNCSPQTIPNSPANATSGGAGLFTRRSAYAMPTKRPTIKEMSIAFIFNSA